MTIRSDYEAVLSELYPGHRCEAIRTVVCLNPEATVEQVIVALPCVNPHTIRIQYRNSRRISAEMDEF